MIAPLHQLAAAVTLLAVVGCEPSAKPISDSPPIAASSAAAVAPRPTATPAPIVSITGATTPNQAASLDELLLFFPSKYPDGVWKPDRLKYEDVSFRAADGTELHGWYCPCADARAVVLFCHGNGGNLATRLERLEALQLDQRVAVFIFDYRGYGKSGGAPTIAGILQDARAARTAAAARAGVAASQLVLFGESLGGAVAVELAAEFGARGLILENTFASLAEVASVHYPKLAWLVPPGKLDSQRSIAKYRGPLLQSHGQDDETIPFAQGEKLFAAAHEPKEFVRVAGGKHNDPPTVDYLNRLERFLERLPKP